MISVAVDSGSPVELVDKEAAMRIALRVYLDDWLAKNPDNFTALSEKAAAHLRSREWEAAKKPLRRLIELDEAGAVVAHLGITRDVTPRKTAEQALQRLNAELEARVRDRTAELERSNAKLRESELRYRLLNDAPTNPDAAHQAPISVDLPVLLAGRVAQVHAPNRI